MSGFSSLAGGSELGAILMGWCRRGSDGGGLELKGKQKLLRVLELRGKNLKIARMVLKLKGNNFENLQGP